MNNLTSLSAISLAMIMLSLITTMLFHQIVFAKNNNNNNNTANTNNDIIGNFLRFNNTNSGVTFSYPSYWNVSQGNNDTAISLTSPLKTVGVRFVTIPFVNMSLDEFTARRISSLRENLLNFNIIRSATQESVSGPVEILVFTYGNGNGNNMSKAIQAWTIKDNKAYIATYFADAVLFDTFLPTAQKILESFQVNTPVIINKAGSTSSTTNAGSTMAKRSSATKENTNNTHNIAIPTLSTNLNYSKILKYDNTSFALSNTNDVTISKNGTATLKSSETIWSRPINQQIILKPDFESLM